MNITDYELEFLKYLRTNNSAFWDSFFQVTSFLGGTVSALAIIIFIYFFYDNKLGKILCFTLFTSLLFNNAIKGIVRFPRPFVKADINSLYTSSATGYSFSSGHTQLTTTLYSSIALNSKLESKFNIRKSTLWIIAFVIIILVGFSRIYLAVHYPKDVIFGIIFGLLITFIFSYIYNNYNEKYGKYINLIILIPFTSLLVIFTFMNKDNLIKYKDYFSSYLLFLGYTIGTFFDGKYINFSTNTSLRKRVYRLLVIGIVVIFIFLIFKLFIPSNFITSPLKYFIMFIVAYIIIPIVFRNNLFKD